MYGSQAQYRAASRMTVDTKMWAEQPLPPIVDRYRTTPIQLIIPEPEPWFPPTGQRYIKQIVEIGASAEIWVTLNAGEQCILVTETSNDQPQTIDPGWTVLAQRSLYNQSWAIVTRTALVNETTLVGSVGPKAFSWNKYTVTGYAFTGVSPIKFTPHLIRETVSATVTMSTWQGAWSSYRMRVICTRGCYAWWLGNGESSGHTHLSLGYTYPLASWFSGSTDLKSNFVGGTFTHNSIGAVGSPNWAEYHIELGRP